jgi:hypothetical protein
MGVVPSQAVFKERPEGPRFEVPAGAEDLLQARIKDLQLHLKGTLLEGYIQRLYQELEAKGLSLKPECYLSDQWGCPSGVPVIGIPFYLADPLLHSLEDTLGAGAESEREIMMYLRHEAGHAFNYAYQLYDTEEWRKLFGDFAKPYKDDFKPQPFSRKYVVHISGWYAQKHPDEDFAETFAVWLTPGSDWETRYAKWGALKKLQYVQATAEMIGKSPARVNTLERDLDVDEIEVTVLEHYRARDLEEKVDLQLGEHLDQDLANLFEAPSEAPVRADTLLRAERQSLMQAVTQYSGVTRPVVRSVLEHLTERTAALGLTVHPEKAREYSLRFTSFLTALSMNFLYTDRFFEL